MSMRFLPFFAWIVWVSASCSTTTNTTAGTTVRPFTKAEVYAFEELIATGLGSGTQYLKKWTQPEVLVAVNDTSYTTIYRELSYAISELNSVLNGNLRYRITPNFNEANLGIYITDRYSYYSIEPAAQPLMEGRNFQGFTYLKWNVQHQIYRASVFISSDVADKWADKRLQRFLLRHELMHSVGLLGHITDGRFGNSLLYAPDSGVNSFSAADSRFIRLLYSPAVVPGMTIKELKAIIKTK